MIIHKFGGTSVGDARCFANVADIIIEHQVGRVGRSAQTSAAGR